MIDLFNKKKLERVSKQLLAEQDKNFRLTRAINNLNKQIDEMCAELIEKYSNRHLSIYNEEAVKLCHYTVTNISQQSGVIMLELTELDGSQIVKFVKPNELKNLTWISDEVFIQTKELYEALHL